MQLGRGMDFCGIGVDRITCRVDHCRIVIGESDGSPGGNLSILHRGGCSICVGWLLAGGGRVRIWICGSHWSHRSCWSNWRRGDWGTRGHRGRCGGDVGGCDRSEGSDGDL